MAQVRLAAGRLDRDRGRAQVVMRAAHAAPGRRLLVLVNGHVYDSSVINNVSRASMLVSHQAAQPCKRQYLPCLLLGSGRGTALMARRIRHGKQELVLD